MRRSYVIGLLAVALILALTAVMQAAGQPGVSLPEQQSGASHPAARDSDATKPEMESGATKRAHASHVWQVTDVIGMEVQGQDREKLGRIENLAIAQETGKIRYAVVSFGTTMGFGGKLLPVPWQALKLVLAAKASEAAPFSGVTLPGPVVLPSQATMTAPYCILNIDKDTLAKAPSFEKGQWPNFNDQKWITVIEQFYRPYIAKRTEGTSTR